ncbi:NAD-dependent epimerase/dehydratase family protein [Nocardiopsis trehalosi]|jgi:nucleoside-diphosphate-sugar epimerase|uniref:NAD-dependent epimerase/dehydratase family protein n=1 Tax=Nocardiopsis trehalosi TaxID=109329 RepID=UPI000835E8F6|nr:NAD(P)-dependent oxidoreductase [Nocardiopsis trehalosi]
MRVLVAGATGAVGRLLVPMLVSAGHEVTGTSRSDAGAERVRALGARGVRADALDRAGLHRVVAEAAPDAVVHQLTDLAGADGAANARLRREGTRNLVDAARAAGTGRVIAQSISWAYAPGTGPAEEGEPLDIGAEPPRSGMVAAVAELEEAVLGFGNGAGTGSGTGIGNGADIGVVLRYGMLYGPGTWYAPGGAVAAALAGEPGPPFLGSLAADDAVGSFVHVEDAAAAAVAALDWPAGPVNVVDDEPAAAREWLPVLAGALGVPAPAPASGAAGWQRGASNALARSRGWRPRWPSWRTGFPASAA